MGRRSKDRADIHEAISGDALLSAHSQRLLQIRQAVGVPARHWDALYQSMLTAFAGYVQLFPASESHHHSEAGGLLRHALDVGRHALTLRRGLMLPAGAPPEMVAERQDLWTYATLASALCHDLGKIAVDLAVQVDGRSWFAFGGPMPIGARYSWAYVRSRRYRLHPRVPPLMLHHLMPAIGMQWLVSDLDVLEAFLAAITGDLDNAGDLGRIVGEADRRSVAEDLHQSGGSGAGAAAGPPSLAQRLVVALRALIDDQTLPLNRPGAAGWVYRGEVWLVAKRALDVLRARVEDEAAPLADSAGVPRRNERLMDELQQRNLLVANGDRAIWTAEVRCGEWRQGFSLLRLKLSTIWPSPDQYPPSPEDIQITPEAPGEVRSPDASAPDRRSETPAQTTAARSNPSQPTEDLSNLPLPPGMEYPSVTDQAEAQSRQHAGAHQQHDEPPDSENGDPPSPRQGDDPFFAWLQEGIRNGRLPMNVATARVHTTAQGLLLVSPGVFRDFAGSEWAQAQRQFLRCKLHQKRTDGTNIWNFRVAGSRRTGRLLKGVLLPFAVLPTELKLPEPNAHLSLAKPDQEEATT